MIKYLGSKRLLLQAIVDAVQSIGDAGHGEAPVRSVIDLFSGTARVGHALKRAGLRVIANDHNAYAATLARCYVAADRERWLGEATRLIAELDALPGKAGWFTATYCEESRYFQPENGARIDAIRDAIAAKGLDPELEAILLVALMEAADRVDSTTGVQMAYLKQWAARSFRPLQLRVPELLPMAVAGKGEAHALEAAEAITAFEADLVYLDPPYNQHKYLGNYHVWETLVRWDRPEVYGVARKRSDCRTRQSDFNSRRSIADAMRHVIAHARCRYLLVSYSDEGFLDRPTLEAMLAERGQVTVFAHDYRRYIGARIGIYNPQGEKVGQVGHLRNTEYLYLVKP